MYKILLAILLGTWAFSSQANVENVQAQLKQKYPKLNIENIQKTEMQGLYSATLDNQIIYMGENAEHILIGSMIRLNDQHNLTKDLVVKNKTIDWSRLPLQDAIKTVKGNGKRQIAVFSDPNCPYCKQLENQFDQLTNVTIYTFIYPIRSQSVQPSKQVWCEANRAYAWNNLIRKGISPQSAATCANPIDRNLKLGQELGIQGTPTLIFSNGFKAAGIQSAQQIEDLWKEFKL
ncbi:MULTISPECIES: DsbC family protein [unclassified Acinetobacter]|uniref:DsbC family protein n=1 Tax=unclassified Acinetobacter TaxID=196816 RepID=UPI00190E3904|nr:MULTISPECIES: DsbC family protein [unclassified Acinetobacter]MBK0065229.1 DsbC family protein [Acinetobacter sp. S55]MBK0068479.1 DsbC family protein [Acinetobacter sp. S54]